MRGIIIGAVGGVVITLMALWAAGGLQLSKPAALSPRDAAEFRFVIKEAIEASRPMCALSSRAENDEIMAAARKELAAFRGRLRGTAYAQQFDDAEADVAYLQSITEVECAKPDDTTEPSTLSRSAVDQMHQHIRLIEAKLPTKL